MADIQTRDLSPLPPVGRAFVGGFESTYLPSFGVDGLDVTGHDDHLGADLDSVLSAGVRHLRYPLRWHRIEVEPGVYDWSDTDRVLGQLHDAGAVVIVDLVHHTSYPDWLSDGFRGPDFGPAYVRFAEAVARRYPWLPAYTLLNEPFTTFWFTGSQALWPPYDFGTAGFTRLMCAVMPALSEAARCWRDLLPAAHHLWVDTAEHHRGQVGVRPPPYWRTSVAISPSTSPSAVISTRTAPRWGRCCSRVRSRCWTLPRCRLMCWV